MVRKHRLQALPLVLISLIFPKEEQSALRQAQEPPFDRLRDHPSTGATKSPSTGSGTTLRIAQGPPFDRCHNEPVELLRAPLTSHPKLYLSTTTISTLRFLRRFSSVSLGATGCESLSPVNSMLEKPLFTI